MSNENLSLFGDVGPAPDPVQAERLRQDLAERFGRWWDQSLRHRPADPVFLVSESICRSVWSDFIERCAPTRHEDETSAAEGVGTVRLDPRSECGPQPWRTALGYHRVGVTKRGRSRADEGRLWLCHIRRILHLADRVLNPEPGRTHVLSPRQLLCETPFGDATGVLACELEDLFDAWNASPAEPSRRSGAGALREGSVSIYRDMWRAFVGFCAPVQDLHKERLQSFNPLDGISTEQLQQFLITSGTGSGRKPATRAESGELSLRYAWRMLHLIDRVLNFGCRATGRPKISTAHELLLQEPYRYANTAQSTPVAETLDDAQTQRLMSHLQAFQSGLSTQNVDWKDVRNAAAAALMLGSGLAPGQVRALRLQDIYVGQSSKDDGLKNLPWRLTVLADGSCPEHHAPVAEWAGRLLTVWLDLRESLQMNAPQVFVATASGKAWSHPACHRAMVTLLDQAGIDGGTPFRLRHTFAARQLLAGHSETQVAEWMGYTDTTPMRRYRHLITSPPQGVV